MTRPDVLPRDTRSTAGPTGLAVPTQLKDNGDGSLTVEFSPRLAGEHRIHVAFGGTPIPGSPFACKVYDVSAIKVAEVAKGVVGRPVTFVVETMNAGPGNLEVTVNNGQVPTSAQSQGQHKYAISFTPKEARLHQVELKFNGENVPGSPFSCSVMDASQVSVSGAGVGKVPVGRQTCFNIDTQGTHELSDLSVTVLSPLRRPVTAEVWSVDENRAMVEYTPTEVGDHSVEVRLGGMLIPGAPFVVKAYDVNKVKVTDVQNGIVGKPVYFCIDASQAGAGNLEIIVSVHGRNVPNYVQSEGNARFRVNFKPQEAASHILSVRFNGEPVPGSPFTCKVTDSSQVVVSGQSLKMSPLSRPAVFTVDPRGVAVSQCVVTVTSPAGQSVPVRLQQGASGRYSAEFQPAEVGPHTVSVVMDSEPVGGSPFTCNIYDVGRVAVTGLENTKVGRPVTFTVDASHAGEGTLELVVTTGKATVRAEVAARSRGLYDVTFVAQEAIPHFVNVTFNEEDVPGSPYKCDVRELDAREQRHIQRKESKMVTARGDGLKQVVSGSWATFDVDAKGMEGEVEVKITGPGGEEVPSRLTHLKSGLYRAEYRASEVGAYTVVVYHGGNTISKQPYLVEVADPSRVRLRPGEPASVGSEAVLKVDASQAGRGTLSVSVRSAGQEVKHSIRDLGAGQYEVIFTPKVAIPHKVDVKYNSVPVTGCPVEMDVRNPAQGKSITASGLGLHQSRANKPTSFVLETLGHAGKEFDVVVTSPTGAAVPVKCYQQKDGNMLVEFVPVVAGPYTVEVLHELKPIRGSPFTCQTYDAAKVIIEELKAKQYSINERIAVNLSRQHAGLAELDVTVTSPLGKNLPIDVTATTEDGEAIEFVPAVPGRYKLAILYGGQEVPGSPLTFVVEEEGVARVSGEGLTGGQVGQAATFQLDASGLMGEPQVQVDGPDSVARTTVEEHEPGLYTVTYTPREVGLFDARVLWNGREVPGSPFHPKVVDPRKVRVIGGWESQQDREGRLELSVAEEKKLVFDVAEAGPGKLRGEVRSGSNATIPCRVDQPSAARSRVSFVPQEAGEHLLYLYWHDVPLPGSPFLAFADTQSASSDSSRVVLRGHGLASARCGQEAEFTIDGSQAGPGAPEVTMSGVKADINVHLHPSGNNVYRAAYTPSVAGAYLLNVAWSGRQIKGCPLKVTVAAVADASRVVCTGEGLRGGVVGHEIKSFVDTRRAGPGELSAHCVGPHKTAFSELYDHQDGTFSLNIKPQEPGRHQLSIKYGGENVPGSPFSLRIAGPPDASKVRVYGPGVEPGVLSLYQSRFMCDTRGAGAGQLTVRIRGPKAAFRVEMQRESQKDRIILCKYDPTEPGDYRIEVKWSGDHVPGSPFHVAIFDTQDELSRYVHGGYSPGSNKLAAAGSEFYGSIYGGYTGQMAWRGSQVQL